MNISTDQLKTRLDQAELIFDAIEGELARSHDLELSILRITEWIKGYREGIAAELKRETTELPSR